MRSTTFETLIKIANIFDKLGMHEIANDIDYLIKEAGSFKFDPNSTENEGRWRLKDPKIYGQFWRRKDDKDAGIGYVMGKEKKTGKTSTQAIRFNKNKWTEAEARKWWNKNKGRFTKVWTEKDWSKWKKENKVNDASDKKFADKEHDWDEVLIDKDGVKKTRGQIRDYYKKNASKLLPYLKDKDVIVLLGIGTNKTVLKRNEGDKRIRITKQDGIDDPNSLEYWINRRAIEFHPTLGKTTKLIYVDLDPKTDKMRSEAKKLTSKVAAVMKKVFPSVKTKVWDSGKRGFHVEGHLSSEVSTDEARHKLKEALDEEFADNSDVTTGLAKGDQIRLDTTTLKNTGSIRAPYSFSVYGRPKLPLGSGENDADDVNYAGDYFPTISFMKLRKIKNPEELLKDYDAKNMVAQVKVDGFKIMATRDGEGTKLFTRRGKDVSANVPELTKELDKMLPHGTTLLGEITVLADGQSISQTQTLLGSKPGGDKKITGDIVYYVYDMLQKDGKKLTDKSWEERDKTLRSVVKDTKHIKVLKNYPFDEREKALKEALDAGGEGIVIKVKTAPYKFKGEGETEPTGEWFKYKPSAKAHTEDVYLDSYTLGEPDSKGHRKAVFPAYQYKDGKPFEVGKLSGMDRTTEADIKKKIDAGKKVVVEVSYQERMSSGKLRHMGWVRLRPDKPLKSVTMS